MTFPELGGGVPVQLQGGGQCRLAVRPQGIGTWGRRGDLGDPTHTDRVVVPAAEQRRPRRCAQCRGVEPVVGQSVSLQPCSGRHRRRPTEHAARPVPDVIEEHDQHVRCTLGREQRLDRRERGVRVFRVVCRQPQMLAIRDRQIARRAPNRSLMRAPPTVRCVQFRILPQAWSGPNRPMRAILRAGTELEIGAPSI